MTRRVDWSAGGRINWNAPELWVCLVLTVAYTALMWLAWGWRWGAGALVVCGAALVLGYATGSLTNVVRRRRAEMDAAERELDETCAGGGDHDGEVPSA